MAAISKVLLSGSTQGKPIHITTTATDGTGDAGLSTGNVIHTAVSGTADIDEVWLYASNTSTTQSVLLTLEWGAQNNVNIQLTTLLNPSEVTLVSPGLTLQNGLIIRAFASVEDKVNLFGYANRIDADG